MLSSGANVIIWVLSCDVIIWDDNTPLFIFPKNFTHSRISDISVIFIEHLVNGIPCWQRCYSFFSLAATWFMFFSLLSAFHSFPLRLHVFSRRHYNFNSHLAFPQKLIKWFSKSSINPVNSFIPPSIVSVLIPIPNF